MIFTLSTVRKTETLSWTWNQKTHDFTKITAIQQCGNYGNFLALLWQKFLESKDFTKQLISQNIFSVKEDFSLFHTIFTKKFFSVEIWFHAKLSFRYTPMDISCLPRPYLPSKRGQIGSLSAGSWSFSQHQFLAACHLGPLLQLLFAWVTEISIVLNQESKKQKGNFSY